MFDAKKLLNQFLGSQVPGAGGSVRDRAGQLGQIARDNPLATGAIAAVLLGTGAGRQLTGSALRLGGLAAIAGLGYQGRPASSRSPRMRPRPPPPSRRSFRLPRAAASAWKTSRTAPTSR